MPEALIEEQNDSPCWIYSNKCKMALPYQEGKALTYYSSGGHTQILSLLSYYYNVDDDAHYCGGLLINLSGQSQAYFAYT
jgi:hypothetical protein